MTVHLLYLNMNQNSHTHISVLSISFHICSIYNVRHYGRQSECGHQGNITTITATAWGLSIRE